MGQNSCQKLEKWRRRQVGGHDLVRREWTCEAKIGNKANKLLHAGTDGHQRIWQHGEKAPNTRGRESPQPKRQSTGESREKRIELRERSVAGC